jgi:hypothetical protein
VHQRHLIPSWSPSERHNEMSSTMSATFKLRSDWMLAWNISWATAQIGKVSEIYEKMHRCHQNMHLLTCMTWNSSRKSVFVLAWMWFPEDGNRWNKYFPIDDIEILNIFEDSWNSVSGKQSRPMHRVAGRIRLRAPGSVCHHWLRSVFCICWMTGWRWLIGENSLIHWDHAHLR